MPSVKVLHYMVAGSDTEYITRNTFYDKSKFTLNRVASLSFDRFTVSMRAESEL